MKEFNGCKNYTLISTETLSDIGSEAFVLRHDKTNAKIVLLKNDDENKGFIIGFKTPQDNATGVPHILEHSVLCGSEKYPVKDAMTEVSKGSLNTFLNAFTYPDRTLYPVASCNNLDFHNLVSVYLDAVFFPRVLKEKKIFMQEGWHYELDSLKGELSFNGVVYNEMKGVYSSPESALSSYIQFSLFPNTQYGVESGGDPAVIPELSYEDFCSFHQKLYHPSNSRIFLYGDMDFEAMLSFIDAEYLSKFDAKMIDSEITLESAFDKPVRIEKEYAVADKEDEKDGTFLTYNVVCSDYTEPKITEVMNAINYALCSVPGAKLKERLLEAGIGKDVYSDLTTDLSQKMFSIVAQDANPEDEDRFIEIVESTIKEIIEEGFDKKALLAAVTSSEFAYREGDFGYYPKAIAFGTFTFEQWLYSDNDIFANLKLNHLYDELREELNEGLFERVLKERVLENPHKTILIMKPKAGLQEEKEDELSKKLSALKDSLSKAELNALIKETKALKKYQEEEDSEEALKTIPTLSISDIKKEINKCEYSVLDVHGIKEIYSELNTNGIAYFNLSFKADNLPYKLILPLSILKTLLGMVNTKNFTYGDLINETNIVSGGISTNTNIYKNSKNPDKFNFSFEIRSKALFGQISAVFNLFNEILFTSDLRDKKRVKENLEQLKVRIQGFMMQSGHAVAISRAASNVNPSSKLNEMLSGMEQYRYLCDILDDYDNKFPELVNDMEEALRLLLVKDNLEVCLGSEKEGKAVFDECLKKFIELLSYENKESEPLTFVPNKENEAFKFSSQVQFAALCGNYIRGTGLIYKGSIQVLKSILNTDYLWTEVRLKGGAYGCMCGFGTNGESMFVSYRDPNLKKTYKAYEGLLKYVANYQGDNEDVERFIISTIGDYDSPLTPSMKTMRAFNFYKSLITNEDKQKERDEILNTTPEEIRSLSVYIKAILDSRAYSCVGGEGVLNKEGDMFDIITPLN